MVQESADQLISNVSDTAFWVAAYRAIEDKRDDALFKDPFAQILTQEKGHNIAKSISSSQYADWTVIIRTIVIDNMLEKLIQEGIDTVVNLGAGLDTRPYRLKLPPSLRWVEVDYPHIIQFKEEKLKEAKSTCQLERVALDLANKNERQNFFQKINSSAKKVAVLTEGVIPYLTQNQVQDLAFDLKSNDCFCYWIAEYLSRETYRHLRTKKKREEMKNAQFEFFPDNWLDFFAQNNWQAKEIVYLVKEGERLNRPFPIPWWAKVLHSLISVKQLEKFREMSGFMLMTPQ